MHYKGALRSSKYPADRTPPGHESLLLNPVQNFWPESLHGCTVKAERAYLRELCQAMYYEGTVSYEPQRFRYFNYGYGTGAQRATFSVKLYTGSNPNTTYPN